MEIKVCITAQHRKMLDQVMDFFEVTADYDLNLMKNGQSLFELTANVITSLEPVLKEYKPDLVLVHGDTTTSTAASLAAYYSGAKVAHVEAGLRTYNKWSPFPEEINRQLPARIADYHFAPTNEAKSNLLKEAIPENNIVITGNTVIDALYIAIEKLKNYEDDEIKNLKTILDSNKKLILVTGHRRENFGEGFLSICDALKTISEKDDVQIIYPVHLNPNVQKPVYAILKGIKNVHLIEPLGYAAFVWLMQQSYIIITDSGGVQEEAPSLGKPVLVMRDTTERPEAVKSGTVKIVGTSKENIILHTNELLTNSALYEKMSTANNPYGDGKAAKRILNFIKSTI